MRRLSYLMMFLMAVLLAACGGGGGSPGLSSGPVSAFSVTAPAALTMQVGLIQSFAIQGGVKPYSVFSSDAAVAVGWMVGDNTVALGTVSAGKATVTIQDVKGSKFDMVVTSGSSTKFYSTAPQTPEVLVIAPGPAGAQTFKLGGGTPPYKAVSSFPSAVTVVVKGTDMTITAVQIAGDPLVVTPVTISMTDSSADPLASRLITNVTLGSIPLAVTPNKLTVFIGDIFRAIITGGTPPYRALVGIDESVLSARIVNGNQLEAVGGQLAEAAVVQIIDSNNVSVPVTVKIVNGQDILRVSPNVLSIPENANTADIILMVYGASATGSIQVFTTDPSLLIPNTPVKNSDGSGYAVKLTGGNTCSAVVTEGSAAVASVVGVDANGDGDFLDAGDTKPVAFQAAIPALGGDRVITITVIDAKGKQGTSTITVKDANGLAGC
jgi:hypothetical protein